MNGDTPTVSVCIANYNGEDLLYSCLASVLDQSWSGSMEVIVHDDASVDGSVQLLREHYPQVRLICSKRNVGFCVANNRMAASARGRYLLLLNNDAELLPDAVSALLHAAGQEDGRSILSLPQYDLITSGLVDRGCLLDPFHAPLPNLNADRRNVAYVIGACLWIPRSLWIELGGFPSWLGSIGEDIWICCHARLRGFPVRVIDGSGYLHRQGASFGGNRINPGGIHTTYRRRFLSERNRLYVASVMTPGPIVWPLLAIHVLAVAVEGLALAIATRNRRAWSEIYGRALGSWVRRRRRLAAVRKSIQRHRTISSWTYLAMMRPWPGKLALLFRHGIPRIE